MQSTRINDLNVVFFDIATSLPKRNNLGTKFDFTPGKGFRIMENKETASFIEDEKKYKEDIKKLLRQYPNHLHNVKRRYELGLEIIQELENEVNPE